MATTKAITGNAIKNNGGTIAFATSASGPITSTVGKALLNVNLNTENLPVSSGTAGYFGHGVTRVSTSQNLAYFNPAFLNRGFSYALLGGTAISNRGSFNGTVKPSSVHTRLTRKIRVVTGWDYVTGEAEGVSVSDAEFKPNGGSLRDDAVNKSNNGEFVYIPAGGRIPTAAAGNAKYYTYTKLY